MAIESLAPGRQAVQTGTPKAGRPIELVPGSTTPETGGRMASATVAAEPQVGTRTGCLVLVVEARQARGTRRVRY